MTSPQTTVAPQRHHKLDPDEETLLEQVANSATHFAGAGLAIAALVLLIVSAAQAGSAWAVVGVVIYGITLIFLFLNSGLYHAMPAGRTKEFFLSMDHVGIFLLIAGTYTPIIFIILTGWDGWILFGIIWGFAITGTLLRLIWLDDMHWSFIGIYLAMGWSGLLYGDKITSGIGPDGLNLILIGGLFYTLGLVFYAWRRLPFNHMAWHLFVLSGSIFHFFALFYYVVPQAAS